MKDPFPSSRAMALSHPNPLFAAKLPTGESSLLDPNKGIVLPFAYGSFALTQIMLGILLFSRMPSDVRLASFGRRNTHLWLFNRGSEECSHLRKLKAENH